jgi:DNA-binding NtrC family response regulator
MALEAQPKLLKAIEERTFRRLGGTATLHSDARVIVATHVPLADAVAQGRFRADLYYRLQVLTITLPPLRARRDEIPALAESLLPRGARLSEAANAALVAYDWPGNIRELKNVMERAVLLAHGPVLRVEHLPLDQLRPALAAAGDASPLPGYSAGLTMAEVERLHIREVLRSVGGHMGRASEVLDLHRNTLTRKVREHGLDADSRFS